MKTEALNHYDTLTADDETTGGPFIRGKYATLTDAAKNDYYTEQLAEIPAGTVLKLDFAGSFGCYAMADVGGVLHRVKILPPDFHKIKLAE